ncbi:u5 small nuclear ribonucleo protein 40 kDa protein-like protein [Endogone sp. FLAS-F59071]|nr:u5 small nuclear ribonucleo protein 40 kDa protein-like protein [Endogone sp. FLAS-F59071]|eukprot:RUS20404.1 u5 small nuclear ribonucleo protein 40 kDa protein-like protein [Endogone sp. FLAS-F59071]
MADKRKNPPSAAAALVKRQRQEDETSDNSAALIITNASSASAVSVVGMIKRTSGLQAPIMLLAGHAGDVFSCRFDPSGQHIASAGFDRQILLWNTYGDCVNYGLIKGHAGVIMELNWSRDGSHIFTCSTDKTLGLWDAATGERVKKFKGHTGFVNSCSPARRGPEIVVSGGDDGLIKLWDQRQKNAVDSFGNKYQVTAVCFSDAGDTVFSGGIDNDIKAWDLRKREVVYTLKGHMDTVSGIRLSPDGSYLLSNAMDNTVRIWDVKPFAPANRCIKTFEGAPHGFEKNLIRPAWSPDGTQIASGAGDRTVVVWDVPSRRILYKLPGHKGCVNDVDFHPREPILVSGSTDHMLFLGEINPSK